ncbi:hypothetical protein JCGZ_26092 [Jatropha curcas]|uniref:Uncharacterized protein n=1 Tax=Jatropha curcas TaxID=180498 RepID=A0A067JEH6_JATCU|nr:hypothetical protein JCGZ_26092 [Jatropha curcas]
MRRTNNLQDDGNYKNVSIFSGRPLASKKMERERKAESNGVKKVMSPCDVEALKKCLEDNKGDHVKCQLQIEAFKSSCSLKKPTSSLQSQTNR